MAHPDEASSSAATAVQPDTAGSDAAATTRPEVPGLSAATVAQPGLTAHSNAPTTMETRGTEGVPEAAIDEKASDKKSSPATTVPLRWEEMMEMLKGVPCFTDAEAHSTRMSDFFSLAKRKWTIPETAEVVMAGIRYMMHMREQLFKQLEVAEAMRAFISHHLGDVEEMRSRLKKVEAELATAQKVVADGAEKLSQLLRGGDGAGIAAQKKELETEYQRQVDEMYFFDYRCCMKKNGIMHDVLSLPCDDEDVIPGGPPC
ncbi:hypothetical protein CK203_035457 [Vitis vinifera]|uniref:Uncharacterized protein n=1 Tax=Vitis vinifera TaxID=29760 RepID=A0A438I3U1_VITVI|nr:hypothetical protein CK203_035457 [Vitis vinifera]